MCSPCQEERECFLDWLYQDINPAMWINGRIISSYFDGFLHYQANSVKSYLSKCVNSILSFTVTACQQGIPVKFYRTAALVNQLSETKKAGTLGVLLKKLNKASVIILDEFGYVPYDRVGSQLLFDFLSEIHEQKPVILNTNLEFSRWVNVLYDEQMTAALVGRLMHHCYLLLFPGENNRLKESSINELYNSISSTDSKELSTN